MTQSKADDNSTIAVSLMMPNGRSAHLQMVADCPECAGRGGRIADLAQHIHDLEGAASRAQEDIEGLRASVEGYRDQIEFLEGDRMAITAERNEAQERIRELEAIVSSRSMPDVTEHTGRIYGAFQAVPGASLLIDRDGIVRGYEREGTCHMLPSHAGDAHTVNNLADEVRKVQMLLRPLDLDALAARAPESLNPEERAALEMWAHSHNMRVRNFVANLATMTDIECDFGDVHEIRTLAQMLTKGGGDPEFPRLYDDAMIDGAIQYLRGYYPGLMTNANWARVAEDLAQKLGMRRAGA